MISYGVISLLALATASTASPISAARRDSSLIPIPPPACLAKANSTALSASNITSGANTTNLTDTSSLSNSNVTGSANTTTTTCVVSASDLQGLMSSLNGTGLSNATSINNCTNLTNSTSSDTTSSSDNSTTTNSTDTATATSSAGNSTDTGSGDTSTDTSSTDTSTDTNTSDTATTDTSTNDSTSDSSAPPASTAPPSGSSSGDDGSSSGIFDPSTGEFTADTSDPSGRRKRSPLRVVLYSMLPRLHHHSLSHHRRLAQADLPALAQKWQDLCLASGGDIFTSDPCVNLAGVAGINALLSTAGVCDQQDNADKMIDFAKSPGVKNQDALIATAIAYRKHPRNAEDIGGGVILSIPYCTKQPRNQELVGVVNEQLPGVNPGLFGGLNSPVVAFGADGTCPAGQTPDASTCSCA